MKRFAHISLLVVPFVILLACAVPALAGASSPIAAGPVRLGDPPPSAQADWTVALYVDADNDLYRMWRRLDVPELERLALTAHVNVVALVDKPGRTGVDLVRLGGGREELLAHYSERDFGDPATLRSFLRKTQTLFPSDRLLVDVWDHGGAWVGLCWDDTSKDHLTMAEVRRALTDAAVPIDILACDTCESADVALAYDVSTTGLVDYLVASEESVPGDGFCYDAMLGPLIADPALPTADVLTAQVDGYERYYLGLPFLAPTSLSAIDLAAVHDMIPDLRVWSQELSAALATEPGRLATDVRRSPGALWSAQVDLGAVAGRMAADPWIASDALRSASAAVEEDVRAAVLDISGTRDTAGFTGMTIWWGVRGEWRRYNRAFSRQTLFAGDAGWYGFLRAVAGLKTRVTWFATPGFLSESLCLNDVRFSDALHGEAVGYVEAWGVTAGVAVSTDDGGASWSIDSFSGSQATLTGVAPFGTRYVTVGSAPMGRAVFLRVGGGRKAASSRLPSTVYMFDVATAGTTAWTSGERVLLATTDAGKTWKKLPAVPPARLTSVALADATHGWVAGEDLMADAGAISASADGGATFTQQYSAPGVSLLDLQALDTQNVWACGGDRLGGHGVILHTADGGATWATQLGGPDVPLLAGVTMRDALEGWAVGAGGAVYHTTDGGTTWVPSTGIPTTADLKAVTFGDARHGCIVGDDGAVLLTADAGTTWIDHETDVTPKRTPSWRAVTHGAR